MLTGAPLALIGLVLFAVLLAARELGAWGHGRLAALADGPVGETSDEGFILSGVLGLLALLIAFTFSLALDRYESRRTAVVAEANAISTAHMRFQLLDEPDRGRMSGLLTHYASTRLAYGLADRAGKPALAGDSAAQRRVLEAAAVEMIRPVRTTPLGSSLTSATNDVMDRGADREAALSAQVPDQVILVLLGYAAVSAAVMGYVLAGARSQHRLATAALFVLLTLAICTILDLDRPQDGGIRVSQAPMAQLVHDLGS